MLLTMVSTEPFALYQTTWWSYIGAGILFLALVWWKVRNWNFIGQTVLLSFLAAGAFSFTQVPDASTYAPAAIAFILELENDGNEGEIAMIIHMALVWFILMLLAGSARYGWLYYQSQNRDSTADSEAKPER